MNIIYFLTFLILYTPIECYSCEVLDVIENIITYNKYTYEYMIEDLDESEYTRCISAKIETYDNVLNIIKHHKLVGH